MQISVRSPALNEKTHITLFIPFCSPPERIKFQSRASQPRKKVPPWRFFFFGVTEIRESMSVEYSEDGDIGDIGVSGAVAFCDILSGAGEVGGRPAGALCRDE